MTDAKRPTTTDSGIPATSDEFSLTVGPPGPIRAARPLPGAEDAALQPRARPRARRPRQGRRRPRLLRGDRRRHASAPRPPSSARSASARRCSLRFSTVAGEQGFADTVRDPRGFAIKFYTEEGNYDLVGNNTPVFFVRDPIEVPGLHPLAEAPARHRHAHQRHAVGLLDAVARDRPPGDDPDVATAARRARWRNMNGYGSHTFSWINAGGEQFWVKYHFKTDQGIENFTDAEAKAMTAEDPDYHRRDLCEAIAARRRTRSGGSRCRSCRSRRRPTTASTRST